MIYLIGGAPRCGKSTMAKLVAKENGATWISADSLEGIAYRYATPIDVPRLFPKNTMRRLTNGSNDRLYSEYTTPQIVKAYRNQSRATWPAIEALAESGIVEDRSYVIEGHQVQPELIADLTDRFGANLIRSVILIRDKLGETVSSLRANRNPNDWVITKTEDPRVHVEIARMIVAYGRQLRPEAKRLGIRVQSMDGDFWKNVYKSAEHLSS